MANYLRQNSRTIDKAIRSFVEQDEKIIIQGMCDLLSEAVQYALSIHDEGHQQHLQIGDTYGWALVNDGKMVALEVDGQRTIFGRAKAFVKRALAFNYDQMENPSLKFREGQTARSLREAIQKVPKKGYVGIVMAGMKASHTWFYVDYEVGILTDTISNVEQKFKTYFKPIV